MSILTSPSAPPTEHDQAPDANPGNEVRADPAAAWPRPRSSGGTGVRNGVVRTRTVRSNTLRALRRMREDRGAATAEYIVATMAAVGFAGLLIVILRGDEVRGILTDLVRSALTVG